MKRLISILLCLVCAFSVFAQDSGGMRKAAPRGFDLFVKVDVPNARVFLNDQIIRAFPVTLKPGRYQLKVSAPGFEPYNRLIEMNQNQTIVVNLQRQGGGMKAPGNPPDPLPGSDSQGGMRNVEPVRQLRPAAFIIDTNADRRDDSPSFQIFVDNNPMIADRGQFFVTPGTHSLRIVQGTLSQTIAVNFDEDALYAIVPQLSMTLSSSRIK
jgi:hypothetical protein